MYIQDLFNPNQKKKLKGNKLVDNSKNLNSVARCLKQSTIKKQPYHAYANMQYSITAQWIENYFEGGYWICWVYTNGYKYVIFSSELLRFMCVMNRKENWYQPIVLSTYMAHLPNQAEKMVIQINHHCNFFLLTKNNKMTTFCNYFWEKILAWSTRKF